MFSSQRCGPTVVVKPPPPGVLPNTNAGSGTVADPFLSIVTGMAAVNGGGTVLLRGGQYVEPVHLKGVSGSSECPIVVRPYRCERPTIDASVLEFRFPSAAWMPAPGGHADEWVSVHPMTPPPGHGSTLNRGAFLRVRRHTRLVSSTGSRTSGRTTSSGPSRRSSAATSTC